MALNYIATEEELIDTLTAHPQPAASTGTGSARPIRRHSLPSRGAGDDRSAQADAVTGDSVETRSVTASLDRGIVAVIARTAARAPPTNGCVKLVMFYQFQQNGIFAKKD